MRHLEWQEKTEAAANSGTLEISRHSDEEHTRAQERMQGTRHPSTSTARASEGEEERGSGGGGGGKNHQPPGRRGV